MSLLPSEITRLKYEMGFNVLSTGAEPYIGVAALFDQVIQPYLAAGAVTTSSTAVVAATTPTLATLTLASVSGVAEGAAVIVDVDSLQERATVRSLSGSTIGVLLSKAHGETFPVTVEGPESIIRALLRKLQALGGLGTDGLIDGALDTAGIKKVDEIEFFGGSGFESRIKQTREMREYWRDELAAALGIERLNGGGGGGSDCSVY
jgi:hypothetical protein